MPHYGCGGQGGMGLLRQKYYAPDLKHFWPKIRKVRSSGYTQYGFIIYLYCILLIWWHSFYVLNLFVVRAVTHFWDHDCKYKNSALPVSGCQKQEMLKFYQLSKTFFLAIS